jgi:hypothetical protein
MAVAVDPDLVVVKVITHSLEGSSTGVGAFLGHWATTVEEVKHVGDLRDGGAIWVARLRTSENKGRLPELIESRSFNRCPVEVVGCPRSEFPGESPLLPDVPELFEGGDVSRIPFTEEDLNKGPRRFRGNVKPPEG